jgi:hypothetical protein
MNRRDRRSSVLSGKGKTRTQRRVTQARLQHLKFMAMSSGDAAVAYAGPSPHAAYKFDRGLNRDIDLTRVCPVRELLIKEDAQHKF